MPNGEVRRPDHGGRRCAKGEVALKFVVNVKVAQAMRTLYVYTLAGDFENNEVESNLPLKSRYGSICLSGIGA